MTKRLGGAAAPTRPSGPVIDVRRHLDGLVDAAAEVTALVARLQRGVVVLRGLSPDAPERAAGEALWLDLTTRLHRALRDAYARHALLRIALPHEEAMALWEAHMPPVDAMDDLGIGQMLDYWRTRTDPPEWITQAEMARVTHLGWPPTGETDAINRGIEAKYGPVPF
jgi:hypothetical protein